MLVACARLLVLIVLTPHTRPRHDSFFLACCIRQQFYDLFHVNVFSVIYKLSLLISIIELFIRKIKMMMILRMRVVGGLEWKISLLGTLISWGFECT